jgi:hypothetical protein
VKWISTVVCQANLRGIHGGGEGANDSEGHAQVKEGRAQVKGGPARQGGGAHG